MSTPSCNITIPPGQGVSPQAGSEPPCAVESVRPVLSGESDMNENNSSKRMRLEVTTVSCASVSDNLVPVTGSSVGVGGVSATVASVNLTTVPSPPAIVSFPTGINLTINNGIINMKKPVAMEGPQTLLVTPASSSLSCPGSGTLPATLVKGTMSPLSAPASSVPLTTFSPSLIGNTQVTQSHTQLKVPNPTPIQLRPQVYNLQGSNIALAMQNRLSLPFQTAGGQNLTVPTSVSNLRTLQPGAIPTTSVFSHVQFQTMAPIRNTAVSMAATSPQQGQQGTAQQMSIRSNTFPVLLNRPLTQLITAQPTRLAPRQLGPQVALQVSGQQQGAAAAILPMFRPNQVQGSKGMCGTSTAGLPVSAMPAQAQQAQLVNQMVAAGAGNQASMTHISFRPNTPGTKVLERPSKIPEARLIPNVAPNRLIRHPGITITTLPSSVMMVDPSATVSQSLDGGAAINNQSKTAATVLSSGSRKPPDMGPGPRALVGEPQVRLPSASQPPVAAAAAAKGEAAVSTMGASPSQVTHAANGQAEGQGQCMGAGEEKKEEHSPKSKKLETDKAGGHPESDFDAMKLMEWNDGIGSLPGSNLKFKVNEFGLMEMVMEEAPEPIMVDSAVGVNTTDMGMSESLSSNTADSPSTLVKRENDPVQKCENCGKFGYLSEFCKSGRFCSQTCVGAYAGKKNLNRKHSLLSPKILMSLKKKKKKHRYLAADAGASGITSAAIQEGGNAEEGRTQAPNQNRKSRGFDWQLYLDEEKAVGAPVRLFRDAISTQRNGFKVGMRLEGIDPKHQSLFCVMSVAETQGHRLRLHFDGYSECYDFWVNADSPFIFPVGWCEKNSKPLQPPKHVPLENFNWSDYLRSTKSVAAPKNLFISQPATTVTPSAFRVGMKLEAVDRKNTELICVATVADTLGDKVLVHFDGWEDVYDYWCDITSPYIHPVGWCQDNARTLSPPCDWKDVETFTWEEYLIQSKSQPVPARAFKPRPPVGFEAGMKVEVVDRRNPILVRVATISEVREHQVLIHFDGWPVMYDYWLDDDSPDIKPPHWCARTGDTLVPPFLDEDLVSGSCPTPGCNGVGHIKGAKYVGHHSAFGCPYSSLNMNKESTLQDRLGSTRIEEGPAAPLFYRSKSDTGEIRKCPTPGCDSSGHITGKFTSHHRLSGCPLYEKNILRMKTELASRPPGRPGRGRKRKNFDFDVRHLREQNTHHGDHRREPTSVMREGIHQSVFMSAVPPAPSQEQPPYWEHHAKLLPGVDQVGGNEVKTWSIEQVASFVSTLPGCRDQEKVFREQQIDGEAFLLLNQADIVKIMNIRLGPALKIFNSILMFKQSCDT